ncbi:MAG: ATP-binding protein [Verrucomicrobiota bacterium]
MTSTVIVLKKCKEGNQVAIMEDVVARKQTEEQLVQGKETIEQRVRERTTELENANRELEAFAYSVSHDLLAPLRVINGYSEIMLEEYTKSLPVEAKNYLEVMNKNTRQMGGLINDLLAFSRLSRQPLKTQTVAPINIVRDVLKDLQVKQIGRCIKFIIGTLPVCQADPSLLKQVYFNLISNALKFTRKRETAIIQVGCQKQKGELVYFVKDNGVGFDMQYVNKLFTAFQRLHSANEYEGSGIGLAIVHRIIRRHSGRVWIEAEADKGTTVYFMLHPALTPIQNKAPIHY